jgi:hypothetical protein
MTKYFIAIKKRSQDLFDLSGLKRFETPVGQYEADPFLLNHEGKDYLFYELWDYKKGRIAFSEIRDLEISKPEIVLEQSYHLSYPMIFREENEIYMIPESGMGRNIQLYRAREFPKKWELANIIWDDGDFADSTIIRYKNKWWLFTIAGNDNNLVILKSDSLRGGWEKVFEKYIEPSRGAGNIFEYEGKLIRPVQYQENGIYGRGIAFKEITLPDYTEKEFKRIRPDWYPNLVGTHTFNANENYVVLDGKLKKSINVMILRIFNLLV